jgi:hypothetical protein
VLGGSGWREETESQCGGFPPLFSDLARIGPDGLDQPSGSEFSEFLTGTEDEDV